MILKNYLNFDDKFTEILGSGAISDENQIDEMFNQFDSFYKRNYKKLIYRGVDEAVYKMYTSSQREWNKDENKVCYCDYITSYLDSVKVWNKGLIQKYLKTFKKKFEKNNIAYYSIMQHNGIPTPLLDFTYNPFVALYFACRNIDKCYFDNDLNDIRNYCSIYWISDEWLPFTGYTRRITDIKMTNFCYDRVFQLDNEELAYNNLNIIAQEGLFLINTSSTLDIVSVLKKMNPRLKQRFFPCRNIHKSLGKIILDKLQQKGINHESLFPDLRKINT